MSRVVDLDAACKFIREYRGRRVALSFHAVGDRDGVGSAIALSSCLPGSTVVTPDFVTNNAKMMLSLAGHKGRISRSFPEDADAVIVTDANNLGVMGRLGKALRDFDGPVLFIDHHPLRKDPLHDNFMVLGGEGFNSASSIVYEIMKRNGEKLSRKAALLLLNGIISDSADFQNAMPSTFRQIGDLLDAAGVGYSDIMEYFHEGAPAEDRYRLVNDIAGARTELAGRYVLMYGQTGRNAGLAADAAIRLGADASVFWSVEGSEGRVSARLRSPLDRKLSIHLGKEMQKVGSRLGGSGGGHPCAAGGYGPRKSGMGEGVDGLVSFLRRKLSAQ